MGIVRFAPRFPHTFYVLVHSLQRRWPRRARWLAVAATLLVIGTAIPPAQAGDRPGATGPVTAYVGQGWG